MSNFLENRHPFWNKMHDRWDYTWENYTGEYAAHDRYELFTRTNKKVLESDKYLHRKVQAETVEAFLERIYTSDPIMVFSTAVDSLNGIAYSTDDNTERDFGDLGDPEDPSSTAYRIFHDADGSGTNWVPLMKQMGIKQTVLHRIWGLVDGIKETTYETEGGDTVSDVVGEATVHLIDPQSVVDWYPNNNPTEVLVKEQADMRTSIMDSADREKDTYMLYTLDGWSRWVDSEGSPQMIDEGEYTFYRDSERELRTLPIFPVEIPLPRDLGYLLSVKQNHLYNAKSIRDFSVRNMSFAFLQIVADEKQYDDIMADIKNGFRVLRKDPDASGEHGYKSPPSDYLSEAGEILDKDKQAFMESAFKTYGDAAKQVTATEIRQESRSGVEAFLNLLVTSLDEFENHVLFLMEQIYFPEDPSRWGKAFVKRDTDFTPKDVDEALEKASTAVLNLDRAGAISTFQKVKRANPDWTDEEIEDEVKRIREERGAVEIPDNMVGA